MTEFQKIIKYLAMAFAMLLSVFIIVSTIWAISFVFRIFNFGGQIINNINEGDNPIIIEEDQASSFKDIENINIKHGAGSLVIKSGENDEIMVYNEGDNKNNYRIKTIGKTLDIRHTSDFGNFLGPSWDGTKNFSLIIILPKDIKLNEVDIDAGAGILSLQDFVTEEFDLNGGAGSMSIKNVEASKVDIKGGAGELIFQDVIFNDSSIRSGVGLLDFHGQLLGKNDISGGVGELNIDIQGSKDDYDIEVDKGLGSLRVDGKKSSNLNLKHENSKHSLDIDGGVGTINIQFTE